MYVIAGGVAVVALSTGCSSSESYDRDDFVASLEDGGVPSDQANCIADGIEGKIDLDALENQDELTEEQTATLTRITQECIAGSSETPLAADDTATSTSTSTSSTTSIPFPASVMQALDCDTITGPSTTETWREWRCTNGSSYALLIDAPATSEGQVVRTYAGRPDYNEFGAGFFRAPGGFVYIPSLQFPGGDALAEQSGVQIVDQFQYVPR